jgi:uncharacterized membrane protein YeaQ/YmgE (transglycosylase-associated protein family)
MDSAAIIVMLVVGAVAGLLANAIVAGPWGLIGYIVAGVIGSLIGGWVLSMTKIDVRLSYPVVGRIIAAAIGAIIAIGVIAIGSGPI